MTNYAPTSTRQQIIRLIHRFAEANGYNVRYASEVLGRSSHLIGRLEAGGEIGEGTADKIKQRAALYWPRGVRRPRYLPPRPADPPNLN